MPSDADGREQLSHIIKQFLLLAEVEVSVVSVVCNVFRSGPHYHPSQFRFTIDSAKFLNDFSHLKGKSMPSSSVEHLTQIIFGRQFQIGKISIDARATVWRNTVPLLHLKTKSGYLFFLQKCRLRHTQALTKIRFANFNSS